MPETKEEVKKKPKPPSKAKIKRVLKTLQEESSKLGYWDKEQFRSICEGESVDLKFLYRRDSRYITTIGLGHVSAPATISICLTKKGKALLEGKEL